MDSTPILRSRSGSEDRFFFAWGVIVFKNLIPIFWRFCFGCIASLRFTCLHCFASLPCFIASHCFASLLLRFASPLLIYEYKLCPIYRASQGLNLCFAPILHL